MKVRQLIARSLLHYRRTHVGVLLGAMTGCAVLVGALGVGDSVRFSLEQLVLARLGRIASAVVANDRFFEHTLAQRFGAKTGTQAAAVLILRGIVTTDVPGQRVNHVQVVGVDASFWELASRPPPFADLPSGNVVINAQLRRRLGVQTGDTVVLRVERVQALPRDTPLVADNDLTVAQRVTVGAVAGDMAFGRFHLQPSQLTPPTVFMPRERLGELVGLPGRANALLTTAPTDATPQTLSMQDALAEVWTLDDAGIEIRELPAAGNRPACIELRSERIFLDAPVAAAALAAGNRSQGVFAYLVNEIRHGSRRTPYSFAAAPGPPLVPPDMEANEVIVNDWLARDLALQPGARIELSYYTLGPYREVIEKTAAFRVRSVVPLDSGLAADPELMPDFPGIAAARNCGDWDPGIPIDLERIRKKDETYWAAHRGTPKVFLTLAVAQQLWRNRFGDLTAVRYPAAQNSLPDLVEAVRSRLSPDALGLQFRAVRREGLAASAESVDFGQLFVGLSFFLILAALLLTALMFRFSVEQRAQDIGVLLSLGFTTRRVRRLILLEGLVLAGAGSVVGAGLGVLYTQAVLAGLGTVWRPAIGLTALQCRVRASTLLGGGGMAWSIAAGALWLVVRKLTQRPVTDLQRAAPAETETPGPRTVRRSLALAGGALAVAATIVLTSDPGRGKATAGVFFGAGTLLLIAGLAATNAGLAWLAGRQDAQHGISLWALGLRSASRRRTRSLAVIAVLACGVFLVVAIGANRHGTLRAAERRDSGTGGFAFFAETTVPILHDLNQAAGRRELGLDNGALASARFVNLRLRDGQDASCLNLNRVKEPRILGVDPREFDARGAFAFVKTDASVPAEHPWLALTQTFDNNTVPAVADYNVIVWSLDKSVGDTLELVDQAGSPFRIKLVGALANSILQGNVIIADSAFTERFPAISGARTFLIDAAPAQRHAIVSELSRQLGDFGMDIVPAAERLAAFNAVENTYLLIFLALGGLALVLGSLGLAVVVGRNVLERRGEIALLTAVGLRRGTVVSLIVREHLALLVAGSACGLVAALVAVAPALAVPGSEVPALPLGAVMLALLAGGALWTVLATRLATRGSLLAALRNE